ncbi:hypothetical protein WJX72_007036 [[Myrmecia] bisecta]|uniref:D-2-hydroxyglutarate dehydrogenase, mitochondrial n=1 Tax=[Myrmecia] bisecta TaxID=41462 RepID=A0AAW1P3I5_9CHLO
MPVIPSTVKIERAEDLARVLQVAEPPLQHLAFKLFHAEGFWSETRRFGDLMLAAGDLSEDRLAGLKLPPKERQSLHTLAQVGLLYAKHELLRKTLAELDASSRAQAWHYVESEHTWHPASVSCWPEYDELVRASVQRLPVTDALFKLMSPSDSKGSVSEASVITWLRSICDQLNGILWQDQRDEGVQYPLVFEQETSQSAPEMVVRLWSDGPEAQQRAAAAQRLVAVELEDGQPSKPIHMGFGIKPLEGDNCPTRLIMEGMHQDSGCSTDGTSLPDAVSIWNMKVDVEPSLRKYIVDALSQLCTVATQAVVKQLRHCIFTNTKHFFFGEFDDQGNLRLAGPFTFNETNPTILERMYYHACTALKTPNAPMTAALAWTHDPAPQQGPSAGGQGAVQGGRGRGRPADDVVGYLGMGTLSNVYICRLASGELAAMKFAATNSPCLADLENESAISLNEQDVEHFQSILGDAGVVTDQHSMQPYNRDWMGKYEGSSSLALRPKTTQQVSQILAHCNQRRLAVVPQGGNTGLVGGSIPVFDEVVLSTSAMRQITSFDEVSGVLVCQAGCVLEALDQHVAEHGFTMPLDLGAKGSCQIGGNVSTNAGGLRLLRYGSLHGTVLGLEAVLADGTVVDTLQTLRKDNTGYDLKQLFIGAEGTLGVVTAVSLLCPPRPPAVHAAYLAVPDFVTVQKTFRRARQRLGEVLSAFEFLDQQALDLTLSVMPSVKNPLPDTQAPFYLVVETSGSNAAHDYEKLEGFLEEAFEEGLVTDGTIAQDSGQVASIWNLRENISVALQHKGPTYKYDLSMPVPEMYGLVEEMRARLAHLPVTVVGYGHLGDGNLHLNIAAESYNEELRKQIEPYVYEWTAARRGSISAEHGLGAMKADCIGYSKAPAAVALMMQIKALFDPHKILNPYKVLPQQALSEQLAAGVAD